MFVVQFKRNGYYLGTLTPRGSNSYVHKEQSKALRFESEEQAGRYVNKVIKLDAGITDPGSVTIIPI